MYGITSNLDLAMTFTSTSKPKCAAQVSFGSLISVEDETRVIIRPGCLSQKALITESVL